MAIIIVNNTADSGAGSLREAIANTKDGDTIKFGSSLSNQKITLNSQITILSNVTIDYRLRVTPSSLSRQGTSIFHLQDGQRELIGVIENQQESDLRSNSFKFV